MFNIKLEEKSFKMRFKALPVKIQRSKNQQGRSTMCPPRGQIGLKDRRGYIKKKHENKMSQLCTDKTHSTKSVDSK